MREEYLERIYTEKNISIYEIFPEIKNLRRFIVSTPWTREILNLPEIYGFKYIDYLKKGVYSVLNSKYFFKIFSEFNEENTNTLIFLRGGLNFSIYELLYTVYGFKKHSVSFMTSQRYQKGEHWRIKHDQYRKFVLSNMMNLFSGDVLATGTTLDNGLTILFDLMKSKGYFLNNFVFFTIGGKKSEEVLMKHLLKFKKFNPKLNFCLIYFEGRFRVVENENEFRICIPETDLIRKGGLLSPEFELSSYENINSHFERCVVYDVGARSFNYKKHIKEVIEYWEKLGNLNITFLDAFYERWFYSGTDREIFNDKINLWRKVDKKRIKKIINGFRKMEKVLKKKDFSKFIKHRIDKLNREVL